MPSKPSVAATAAATAAVMAAVICGVMGGEERRWRRSGMGWGKAV